MQCDAFAWLVRRCRVTVSDCVRLCLQVASAGKFFTDEKAETGLQTGEDSKFFGISAGFESFSNEGAGPRCS